MKVKVIIASILVFIVTGIVLADSNDRFVTYWDVDNLDFEAPLTTLDYPSIPLGTYEIAYDTEPNDASWGPILTSSYPQHLRVRFTPEANGQLVQEARIKWAGPWGGNNQFEIHIVDVSTGNTKKTSVLYEPDPWDWKIYDVGNLCFYTSGDFYIEFWAIDCEIGIYVDDTPPVYYRSEVNRGDDWFYPDEWEDSDFRIRAVVSTDSVVGSINGTVTDAETGNPIKWALVIAVQKPTRKGTLTKLNGSYEIADLIPGDWWVIVLEKGYKPSIAKVTVEAGKTTTKDFILTPKTE